MTLTTEKDGTMSNQPTLFDREEGRALRDHGTTLALEAQKEWRTRAERWLACLPVGTRFTADDLVPDVGLPTGDVGMNKNIAVGAWVSGMSRRRLIRKVGYANGTRTSGHASVLVIWQVSR